MQGDRRISEWPFEPNDEGDAAEGLLPAGAWDWDQVLGPTLKFLPWPYTDVEFVRIWDALPHPGAALATKEAIFAALVSSFGLSAPEAWHRAKSGPLQRTQAHYSRFEGT
jgi:hypothetical protein